MTNQITPEEAALELSSLLFQRVVINGRLMNFADWALSIINQQRQQAVEEACKEWDSRIAELEAEVERLKNACLKTGIATFSVMANDADKLEEKIAELEAVIQKQKDDFCAEISDLKICKCKKPESIPVPAGNPFLDIHPVEAQATLKEQSEMIKKLRGCLKNCFPISPEFVRQRDALLQETGGEG